MAGAPRHRVPLGTTRVETRAGNSRFIATLARAGSVEEARAFIASVRAEMPDATHHVHAFRAGFGASVTEGMSDDGEPSGTSGPPVLAVLRGSGLGDVAVVVTRYFGGTKLGTGGLVSAYGDAAKAVVEAAPTEEKVERAAVRLDVPYALLETARRALHEAGATGVREDFGAFVAIEAAVPVDAREELARVLRDASAGHVELRDA